MGVEPNQVADAGHSLAVGELSGQHVVLERLRIGHVDEIARAGAGDAPGDRAAFGFTHVPSNDDQAARYVATLLDDADHHLAAPFVQRRPSDGRVVGCTRFMNPAWPLGRRDPDEVEIGGTWLVNDARRTPVNSEAKLLLLTHAFEVWSVRRVAICADERNERSRRAIERLGATFEGVLRQHRRSTVALEEGQLRNTAVYSIVAGEWPPIRTRLTGRLTGRLAGGDPVERHTTP